MSLVSSWAEAAVCALSESAQWVGSVDPLSTTLDLQVALLRKGSFIHFFIQQTLSAMFTPHRVTFFPAYSVFILNPPWFPYSSVGTALLRLFGLDLSALPFSEQPVYLSLSLFDSPGHKLALACWVV